jgi:hypothetical protein
MSGFNVWEWDPALAQYYWFSRQRQAYIFGDGSVIPLDACNTRFYGETKDEDGTEEHQRGVSENYPTISAGKANAQMQLEADDSRDDPSFRLRADTTSFFTPGRIFCTRWPVPSQYREKDKATQVKSKGESKGESIHTKLQWFVVVRQENERGHCFCLRINTFSDMGVTKRMKQTLLVLLDLNGRYIHLLTLISSIIYDGQKEPPIWGELKTG